MYGMRILIIEDDVALGLFLAKGLKLEGHEVELLGDGQVGLDRAVEAQPDLMVLDLGLPQKDGIEVLRELRGRLTRTSILVLTGRSTVEDRVSCLNLGADDCLLKPFSFNELTARCRALLRRREQFADPVLRVNGVELNRMDRRVIRDGRRIELTSKEFALLEYLMQAQGRVCLRSDVLRDVWQSSPSAGTNVVDVYVNYLRKKLNVPIADRGQDFFLSERIIETVRGEGYVMADVLAKKPSGSIPRYGNGDTLPIRAGMAVWDAEGRASA
jgi:DNA-binding response OmpR family regulator